MAKHDTPDRSDKWADAIESADNVILRWGESQQMRQVPPELVEKIVAALRAPVSELPSIPTEAQLDALIAWHEGPAWKKVYSSTWEVATKNDLRALLSASSNERSGS